MKIKLDPLIKTRKTITVDGYKVRYVQRNRQYVHFDLPLNFKKATAYSRSINQDKKLAVSHQWLPMISYEQVFFKLSASVSKGKKKLKRRIKIRPLVEVSHTDAVFYSLYAAKLNDLYEDRVQIKGIENVATAYRRKGGSNIRASKEVFDIIASDSCWILKGDFVSFFDNLNHKILKRNVSSLLGEDRLPEDWYSVIRSILKHRETIKDDLPKYMKCNARQNNRYVNNLRELDRAIAKGELNISKAHSVGIPQGTSISAVLANVYMLKFDECVNDLVDSVGGTYRRYSDDFILVISGNVSIFKMRDIKRTIQSMAQTMVHLKLDSKKTKFLKFDKSQKRIFKLDNVGAIENDSVIDYLGFVFDGKRVSLRSKGLFKYTYKAKRSIRLTANQQEQIRLGKTHSLKNYRSVYETAAEYYLDMDEQARSYRDYAARAERVFLEETGEYDVIIDRQARKIVKHTQKYLHTIRKSYYRRDQTKE